MQGATKTWLLQDFYRVRGSVRQARTRRQERRASAEFAEFQRGLASRDDVIYMFFTRGLLHWLAHSIRFVPDDVPVALIGARLSEQERAWVERNTVQPFHHFDISMDDNAVLDLIFRTRKKNFGWLHIDCWVLDPSLFGEMASLADDVALNCTWIHPGASGLDTAHSAFVFVNAGIAAKVAGAGVDVSPCTYHYKGWSRGRTTTDRDLFSRVPSRRQVRLLRRLDGSRGRALPFYTDDRSYFQVLVMYELICRALGWKVRQVRPLVRDGTDSQSQYSNDILHVNGVASYRRFKHAPDTILGRFYPLLLQADFAMLQRFAPDAPGDYLEASRERASELEEMNLPAHRVEESLLEFLVARGVERDQARYALGPG